MKLWRKFHEGHDWVPLAVKYDVKREELPVFCRGARNMISIWRQRAGSNRRTGNLETANRTTIFQSTELSGPSADNTTQANRNK